MIIIIGQAVPIWHFADDAMLQKSGWSYYKAWNWPKYLRGNNTIKQAYKATPTSLAGAS